ncbi:MAG: DNA repair and recombination protein RadA [Methanomassiliicoccales archaeon PtaU1.Bin124]|nr:MAG: DNA repair and recombination protein RadA [Methanomassiliicoccales archaeon PtaU1.Bin124]
MEFSYLEAESQADICIESEAPRCRALTTSVPPIDSLLDALQPGTITLIDSSDRLVFELVNLYCFNAVHRLHEEVLWIDGGNSVNPYELNAVCKRHHVNPEDVLHNVTVSRAFTAYQMSTLIEDLLDPEVRRIRTGLVVISCFPDLFQDKDMEWGESLQLMRRAMDRLRHLTVDHQLITVVTNYGLNKLLFKKGLKPLLYDGVDRVVRIENKGTAVRILLPKEGEGIMYRPVPRNQTTLDEYHES